MADSNEAERRKQEQARELRRQASIDHANHARALRGQPPIPEELRARFGEEIRLAAARYRTEYDPFGEW